MTYVGDRVIELYRRDGELVGCPMVPPYPELPGVVMYDDRVYVHTNDNRYQESTWVRFD